MTSVSLRLIFKYLLPPVFTCWKMNPVRQISLGIQPDSGHVTVPHIYWTPTISKGIAWCSIMQYVVYNLKLNLYYDAILPSRTLSVYFRFILAWTYTYIHSEPHSCTIQPGWLTELRGQLCRCSAVCPWVRLRTALQTQELWIPLCSGPSIFPSLTLPNTVLNSSEMGEL